MSCDLRQKLNVKITSPYWEEACENVAKEPGVPQWLTEGYIRGLHEEYGIFPENLESLVEGAKKVVYLPGKEQCPGCVPIRIQIEGERPLRGGG